MGVQDGPQPMGSSLRRWRGWGEHLMPGFTIDQKRLLFFFGLLGVSTNISSPGSVIVTGLALQAGLRAADIGVAMGLVTLIPALLNMTLALRMAIGGRLVTSTCLLYGLRLTATLLFPLMLVLSGHTLIMGIFVGTCLAMAVCYTVANTNLDGLTRALVSPDSFGKYMALVNVSGILGFLCQLMVTSLFDLSKAAWVYALVFLAAAMFGLIPLGILRRIPEPAVRTQTAATHSWRVIIHPLRDRAYRRFMIFYAIWSLLLATYMPFCMVVLLSHLHLPYSLVSLAVLGAALLQIPVMGWWGRATDRWGVGRVFLVAGLLWSLGQGLLLVPHGWAGLLFLLTFGPYAMSGLIGVGLGTATSVLRLSAVGQRWPSTYLAMSGLVTGITGMVGGWLGGRFLDTPGFFPVGMCGGSAVVLLFAVFIHHFPLADDVPESKLAVIEG